MSKRHDADLARYPFQAVLEDEDGGAWAIFFPDAPGCMTRAETWADIGPAAESAIRSWLDGMTHPPAPTYDLPHILSAAGQAVLDRHPAPDPATQTIFTVRDVAAYAGISRSRVQQIATEQGIGEVAGTTRIFGRADLAAFVDRRPAGRPRKGEPVAQTG